MENETINENTDRVVQIFDNPEIGKIRVCGTPQKPMFCLADVCRILGIGTPANLRQRLDERGIDSINTPTKNQWGAVVMQNMTYIDEPNLYRCIFQSRKEEATRFQDWVFDEILPTVRKHGVYATGEILERLLSDPDNAIKIFTTLKVEREENARLRHENQVLQRKATFVDTVLQSSDTYTFQQVAKDIGFRSATGLYRMLIAKRILFKQSGSYLPFAQYADKGYFQTRTTTFTRSNGSVGTNAYTVLTEKGRVWMHRLKEAGRLT